MHKMNWGIVLIFATIFLLGHGFGYAEGYFRGKRAAQSEDFSYVQRCVEVQHGTVKPGVASLSGRTSCWLGNTVIEFGTSQTWPVVFERYDDGPTCSPDFSSLPCISKHAQFLVWPDRTEAHQGTEWVSSVNNGSSVRVEVKRRK